MKITGYYDGILIKKVFKYNFRSNKSTNKLPLIKINLNRFYPITALVDTGSTGIYLPYKCRSLLNDESSHISNTATVAGGTFSVIETIIPQLEIIGLKEYRNVHVSIAKSENNDVPFGIIGRNSILKNYDLIFSDKSKKLTIQTDKNEW